MVWGLFSFSAELQSPSFSIPEPSKLFPESGIFPSRFSPLQSFPSTSSLETCKWSQLTSSSCPQSGFISVDQPVTSAGRWRSSFCLWGCSCLSLFFVGRFFSQACDSLRADCLLTISARRGDLDESEDFRCRRSSRRTAFRFISAMCCGDIRRKLLQKMIRPVQWASLGRAREAEHFETSSRILPSSVPVLFAASRSGRS